jgi:hypothetical protein
MLDFVINNANFILANGQAIVAAAAIIGIALWFLKKFSGG